ncbi:hypothetical protein SPI_05246 [Niveomyces insectorum RCEF 264]|uniref:Uncharacterized protein n=1 Tax=Niveomyces insectorum RCEF 264 TaxID=1081102 RepID=A0A167U3Y3_9HYPO|nr:hypothetical protein SPI_05246 [Niveomyces insectorum RCEF 264]
MPSVAQEAFDGGHHHHQHHNHNNHNSLLSKKRRRDEFAGGLPASCSVHSLRNGAWDAPAAPLRESDDSGSSSKVVTLLVHDAHLAQPNHDDHNNTLTALSHAAPGRRILPVAKRLRCDEEDGRQPPGKALPPSSAAHDRTAESATTTLAPPRTTLTTPCHICQRRPRRKCDLDSVADCEGCGQRTCFVCLRECVGWGRTDAARLRRGPRPRTRGADHGQHHPHHHGNRHHGTEAAAAPSSSSCSMPDAWPSAATPAAADGRDERNENTTTPGLGPHPLLLDDDGDDGADENNDSAGPWAAHSKGHRRMICSQCCVERGEDGDVVCLGCMASIEA